MIATTPCQIACLQETKLHTIDTELARFLGAYKLNSHIYKPANGTRGGILLLWNDTVVNVSNTQIGSYSISADVTNRHCMSTYRMTTVYGPSRRGDKEAFLRHLRNLKPGDDTRWLLLGDFNLIYRARDKNNRNLNLRLMRRFRQTLNRCELKEISLQNRKYTWSNERTNPTLVRLDRVFCNQSWDLYFENCLLHALSSAHSDHCPILLATQDDRRRPTPFRFENFWTKLPGFHDTVRQAWDAPTTHTEPFHRLGHKLHQTARALKRWSASLLSNTKMKMLMAKQVILRLDEAQDHRQLTPEETWLRGKLKKRMLGWAVVEKARKRQCSRITYLKEGDANTKFFHLKANGRKRKNFIQRLSNGSTWACKHEDKQNIIEEHFQTIMERPPPRTSDLNWNLMNLPHVDLSSLAAPFTEDEILQAINQSPQDKAPGPDGFTGLFFKECWLIIKADVLAAIHAIYDHRCADLNLINKANIVLIPKKEGADDIRDFRPISLIHAAVKITNKILALRLAPLMNELISPSQSAFIKGRTIHDNFLYVRNLARRFHRTQTPALLMKLDISKAFDSVRWDYLITLLQKRGFPVKWIDWITALLASSTSRVLLNGIPLKHIAHGRGLRQGDPLSPLLFILAIDPLHRLFEVATERGLLSKLNGRSARLRVSMYADDAAIFLKPTPQDVNNMKELLIKFGETTGLSTNIQKTSVTPIRCRNIDLDDILGNLPVKRQHFPLKYLGLPLTVRRLRKVDLQPLLDKAMNRLSVWNGKNLTQAGRISLTKSVLSSQPVYLLTVLRPTKEVLEGIDKIRKTFLWAGDKALTGAKCKVNWTKTTLPKEHGGLGILSLDKFARALRVRWLWHEWVSPNKAWVGMDTPCDEKDRLLFAACTTLSVGNGQRVRFWKDAWVQGRRPMDIAPNLFNRTKRKGKTVAQAMENNNWIRDLNYRYGFTVALLHEFFILWALVRNTELQPAQEDRITWKLTQNGQYSAVSAYKAQFLGSARQPRIAALWNAWAPPKCKFFAWLILQNRIWSSDRLAQRGWDHSPTCPLCRCAMETSHHMLAECRFTRRIWTLTSTWSAQPTLAPNEWRQSSTSLEWWTNITTTSELPRKGITSLTLLIVWEIWKERNARVFRNHGRPVGSLMSAIKGEASAWIAAGAKGLESFLARE